MNGRRNETERKALFAEIGQVSFVMDELRLFLDTHPEDGEALTLFDRFRKRRAELVSAYQTKYGPMEAYMASSDGGVWNWTEDPMPWETEAD